MKGIPELLKTISGEEIKTAEEWERFRRPEIMNLFSEYIYGVRPVEKPKDLSFKTVKSVSGFNSEKVLFEKIEFTFGGYSFYAYGYIPEGISGKMPAFVYVMHEFEEERCDIENSLECEYVDFREIFKRGYAIFVLPTSGIYPDWEHKADFEKGIHSVITPDKNDRRDNSWATISSWAWGASRVFDYIETLDYIDSEKVTVCGHSRGGKTALWAGATDTRFVCSISNNSGCAGAAMHRTKVGEHIKDINITDWFCKNYHKFNDNEDMLPVDQHMLIASIAPRLVYIASSSEDEWADPVAERLSGRMAEPVYNLYGKKGIVLPDEPVELDKAYHDGTIGCHAKTGSHGITHYDWKMYLDFLDKKIK